MDIAPLLTEVYDRIPPLVEAAVEGLDSSQLAWQPGPGANPVGWLAWHIGRVEDAQIADITGHDQVWTEGKWALRMGLEPDPANTGYGHTPQQAAAVRPESAEVLVGYLHAVQSVARSFLATLTASDLDRVVDRRWDPPVTLGVRLVSVADDCLQHAGQAAYVRGLIGP